MYLLARHVPSNKVLEGAYGNEWIQMNLVYQREFPVYDPLDPEYLVHKYTNPKTNKTTQLITHYCRARMLPKELKDRFIISRFRNTPKRIDNYNNTPLNRNRPPSPFVNYPVPPRLARSLDRPWNWKTLEAEQKRAAERSKQKCGAQA